MKEEWRVHPEWTDYEVSDRGRVRRVTGGSGAIPYAVLKGSFNKDTGYRGVRLYGLHSHTIHKLVLEAFRGPRPHGMEARHLDGDGTNNRLSNLCWGTHAENYADRIRHGTAPIGSNSASAKLTEVDVDAIRSRYVPHVVTLKILGQEFGVSAAHISNILKRHTWTHVP